MILLKCTRSKEAWIKLIFSLFFPQSREFQTWRHKFTVRGERFKRDPGRNIFTQTVAQIWNGLSKEAGETETENIWIRKLDSEGPNAGNQPKLVT